ncbi:MAG: ABC transporter permease, partial [Chloroflexota bacterium]
MIPRLPIGEYVEDFIRFLRDNFGFIFDLISSFIEGSVDNLAALLTFPPPIIFAILLGALGIWLRSIWFGLFVVISFLLIESMELWAEAMDTLALVLVASIVAIILAIPVGILATRSRTVSVIVRPVLDFMQTLPAFVYLLPALFFFGIGVVPGVIATLIFSMPPAVRLTELGIRGVD